METLSNVRLEKRPRTVSEQAAGFFRRASSLYPASVTAQAAEVALLAQGHDVSASILWSALRGDAAEIGQLARDATRAHARNPKAPRVNREMVVSIAGQVFCDAHRMRRLRQADLTEIGAMYPQLTGGIIDRAEYKRVALRVVELNDLVQNGRQRGHHSEQ